MIGKTRKRRFKPYISHSLTVWRYGRVTKLLEFWRGDDAWPASVHLCYKWRNTVYWHVWFYGLWRVAK